MILLPHISSQELLRFQTKGPSCSSHSSSSALLDPNPVTIDSVLEIEVESSFIPSSPHYRSNIPNPHQREFLIIQSLSELSSPASVSLQHPSPRPSASHSSGSGSRSAEKDDTVKELATLLLTIFHQCHALPLLQSLQISAVTTATAAPPPPTAALSSASSPYAILISICDPSLSQCESRYGKMMTMISSSCSSVSPSLLPLIEEQSQGQGGDEEEEDEI
jgi:hypothetical protein